MKAPAQWLPMQALQQQQTNPAEVSVFALASTNSSSDIRFLAGTTNSGINLAINTVQDHGPLMSGTFSLSVGVSIRGETYKSFS